MSKQAIWVERPTYDALCDAAEKCAEQGDLPLILVGDQTQLDLRRLWDGLCSRQIRFAGGVVPAVIYGANVYPDAGLICPLPCQDELVVVTQLGTVQEEMPIGITRWAEKAHLSGRAGLLILVDGYADGIGCFLAKLSGLLGPRVTCFGGGTGFSALVQRPCLFTRAGIFTNAALAALIETPISCAVRHGWVRIGYPLIATKTSGNTLCELNWRKAFDVYREALFSACGKSITRENFPVLSREHPLGIIREGGENLIRDPIGVGQDGSLLCVGEIPENATVSLMEGEVKALIKASATVAREAMRGVSGKPLLVWTADCVSRHLFLGERFDDELQAAQQEVHAHCPDIEFCGFLSFSEIASSPCGRIQFYNKTVVTAVLYE